MLKAFVGQFMIRSRQVRPVGDQSRKARVEKRNNRKEPVRGRARKERNQERERGTEDMELGKSKEEIAADVLAGWHPCKYLAYKFGCDTTERYNL